MVERSNCWEAMRCGREAGGRNVEELGVCPAAKHSKQNGINRGPYSGRFCWTVEGTLCGGEVQGTFAEKLSNCLNCKFLKQVHKDEGRDFILSPKDIKKR